MNLRSAILSAAVTGLMGALTACGAPAADPKAPATNVAPPQEKNCCAGKNDCKGKSGCKVGESASCAGKNDCKGKGTACAKAG